MHPLTSPAGDGLAGPGFGFPDWATRVAAALMRTFDLGNAVARMDKPNGSVPRCSVSSQRTATRVASGSPPAARLPPCCIR